MRKIQLKKHKEHIKHNNTNNTDATENYRTIITLCCQNDIVKCNFATADFLFCGDVNSHVNNQYPHKVHLRSIIGHIPFNVVPLRVTPLSRFMVSSCF